MTANRIVLANRITVRELTAIGETVENVDVVRHDLPEGSRIEGLLGLNFLRHFDVNISFLTGTIELRPHSSYLGRKSLPTANSENLQIREKI